MSPTTTRWPLLSISSHVEKRSARGNELGDREVVEGRGPQWNNDGFTSVMSATLNKAVVIGNGDEGLSVGGRVEKGEIPEVKLQANKDSKADRWELAICEAREEPVGVFTDGSMNEEGKVGGKWHEEGLGGGKEGLGKLATVWDEEVVGMRGGLQSAPRGLLFLRFGGLGV